MNTTVSPLPVRRAKAAPARWRGLVVPLVAIVLWALVSKLDLVNSALLVSPAKVVETGWHLISSGLLWLNLRASLARELTGFVIG
ncbi:MAG: ABC transporter permease, partial [Comamonas sp.]